MSLILDALKRADQERHQGGEAPTLATEHILLPPPSTALAVKWRWLAVIGFLVVLALAMVAWRSLTIPLAMQSLTEPTREGLEAKLSVVPQRADISNEAPASAEMGGDQSAASESIPLEASMPIVTLVAAEPSSSPRLVDEAINSKAKEQVSELYAIEATPADVRKNEVVDALYSPELDAPPQVETYSLPPNEPTQDVEHSHEPEADANSLSQYNAIVWFMDLPWQVKMEIPSINYSQHNANAAPPTVMINGLLLQEGQSAGELSLRHIATDGCVFEFRGQEFKLAALSGWINL